MVREIPKGFGAITLLLAITACEHSGGWVMTHPDRQRVTVDGYELDVIPQGERVDIVGTGFVFSVSDAVAFKQAQIKAAEQVTGCQVVDYAYIQEPRYMQAKVSC